MTSTIPSPVHTALHRGVAIPASPLALSADRSLDGRRQRALWRYYSDAGAGGIAVGVHTTQFAIRDPKIALFEPILALASDEFDRLDRGRPEPLVRVAGICGPTRQAVAEAELARRHRFHCGLLSLSAWRDAETEAVLDHCRAVAEVIDLFGFYLQPAVGGRVLPYAFWRRFAEIPAVAAIKIAPFDRYRTLDVVRAVAESGRDDIALYTGNDDNIVADLLTEFRFSVGARTVRRRIVGGLLGHWAVWTAAAVALLERCHVAVESPNAAEYASLLAAGAEVTDMNAALFDAAGGFAGCIPGIHEILVRQGLLEGPWCLDPQETLSPGQAAELDRVCAAHPHWTDDAFVAENRARWLEEA